MRAILPLLIALAGCSDPAPYCEPKDKAAEVDLSQDVDMLYSLSIQLAHCRLFCSAFAKEGEMYVGQTDVSAKSCSCNIVEITGLGGRAAGDEMQREGPAGPDGGTRAPSGPNREEGR